MSPLYSYIQALKSANATITLKLTSGEKFVLSPSQYSISTAGVLRFISASTKLRAMEETSVDSVEYASGINIT